MRKVLFICLGLILATIIILTGALSYRLAQGPIDLNFAEGKIKSQLEKSFPELSISFKNPKLDWSNKSRSIVINITDLLIKNNQNITVTDFPSLAFGISIPHLIGREIIPTSLEIEDPMIKLYRNFDNRISFHILHETDKTDEIAFLSETDKKTVENKLQLMIKNIRTIYIKSGNIDIIDKKKNKSWHLKDINLELLQNGAVLSGEYEGKLFLNKKSINISGDLTHKIWEHSTQLTSTFADLNTQDILNTFPNLKFLSYIQTTFQGDANLQFESNFNIVSAHLNLNSQKGILDIPEAFNHKITFDSIDFRGSYDGIKGITTIQDLEFQKDTYSLNFAGTATQSSKHTHLQLDAFIKNFPIDLLDYYWPPEANPPSREWVTKNISKGIINSAWAILDLEINNHNYTLKKLNKLNGEIDASNITINYYKNLPKITNIDMQASFDQTGFDIIPQNGHINDLKISDAHVVINGFSEETQKIYIDVTTSGSLKTALNILDTKPLSLIKGYGLNKTAFSGKVQNKLHMDFPLTYSLTRKEMNITTDAKVQDMNCKNIIPNLSLIDADFNLKLDNKTLSIKGETSIANNHRQLNFTLDEVFSDIPSQVNRVITASGPLYSEAIQVFIPKSKAFIKGHINTKITIINKGSNNTFLKADLNLKNSEIKLPGSNFIKKHGQNARLSFSSELDKTYAIKNIKDIKFIENKTLLNANYYAPTKNNWNLQINALDWGGENLKGFVKFSAEKGYDIDISGKELNLDTILSTEKALEDEPQNTVVNIPNFLAKIKVDSLVFKPHKTLEKVDVLIHYQDQAFKRVKAKGLLGQTKEMFLLDYGAINSTRQHFLFETHNFGDFLDHIGAVSNYSGGDIKITGEKLINDKSIKLIAKMGPYKSTETPEITKIADVDAPAIKEIKSKDNIKFDALDATMIFDESTLVLNLKNLKTKGPSIGISAKGKIDFYHQTLNLRGLFAPIQTINKIINFIPIIGKILTGFSGNLIVIEYKVKGSFKDPKTSVNPLPALVPGILRDFFVN